MTKELQEKVTNITALVTAIVALGATLKGLREALQGAATEVWRNWPWYVVPGVVFLAILLWRRGRLVQWLNPRSTVSRRDAFHIGRKYLLGREADIERLLRTLSEWPLVFLVGESGAGKSSLLERGVLPRLKEVPGQFPLLINSWGPDWIEGPREALAQALEAALDEPLRKLLGVEGPVAPGNALAIVGRLRSKATRTPILLFDQVDDYQTRHRDKFLDGPDHTLLSAEALAAANPFWREVADLLKSGGIRCLFTTRSDAKIGLESFRFQEPKVYLLDPLEKSAAADLLAEISKDAVHHPERSFERLRERLQDDLAADGWVLPIQMQVAFSGLAELHLLSVGEYERQGGLPGLEALHLESRISAAARAVSVSMADVRAVLLSMVDRATRKTVPQPIEKFLPLFPGGNPSIVDLLEKLEVDEVVRRRIDPGGEGNVWLLDHDYLSRGVLELDRRAQRWHRLLEEAARSYEGSRGVLERWQKLLPPVLQVRLLYERLRGRLSYGSAAAYARVSTVRVIVWLLIPLVAWLGWNLFSIQKESERLFAEFGEEDMTKGELQALWKLAGSKRSLRHAFIDTALAHGPNARRFKVRSELTLHAVIGLREEDREYILEDVVRSRCMPRDSKNPTMDLEMINACSMVIQQIVITPEDLGEILRSWLPIAKEPEVLNIIVNIINEYPGALDARVARWLSDNLFDPHAELGKYERSSVWYLLARKDPHLLATRFIRHLKDNKNNLRFGVYGFGELGDAVTPAGLEELTRHIVLLLKKSAGSKESISGSFVNGVPGRSDAKRILELYSKNNREGHLSNRESWHTLVAALDSVAAREDILRKVDFLSYDAEVVSRQVRRLNEDDAMLLLYSALEDSALERDGAGDILLLLVQSPDLSTILTERLSPADVEKLSRSLLAMMRTEPKWGEKILFMFWILGDKMHPEVAQDVSGLLLDRLDRAQGREERMPLWWLSKLGSLLEPSVSDLVFRRLTERARVSDKDEVDIWAGSIANLTATMPNDRVRETAALIVDHLKDTAISSDVLKLIDLLGPRLKPEEGQRIQRALLRRIEEDPSELHAISMALASVSKNASAKSMQPALQKWLDANRLSGNPNCEEIMPFIRNPTDFWVIDLLKWPTCHNRSRDILISKLDDLVEKESFGSKDSDGLYRADIWGKFLPWARKQGLDVESPPILPDLDRLDVERDRRLE